MILSKEERIMYGVMSALYESGIPISYKGSMVLKACLEEAGYNEETRHTVDIDCNWCSETIPEEEHMLESLQKAFDSKGMMLDVGIYRMYHGGNSVGFELKDVNTGEVLFTMDIDVNRTIASTKIYNLDDFCFVGATPAQILVDKISAISTDKVFQRVKDIVDLYYLSNVFSFDKEDILQIAKETGRSIGDFEGFLYRTEELKHAYEKFRFTGKANKPDFSTMYSIVKDYIKEFLPV